MPDTRTLGHLYKAKTITEADLVEAVDAYLADPSPGPRQIGPVTLDIGAAVAAHPWASRAMADPETKPEARRTAVQTAVLLAEAAPPEREIR